MRRGTLIGTAVAGAAVLAGLGWLVADRVYLRPKAKLEAEIERSRGYIAGYETNLAGEGEVRRALEEIAATTLGRTPDAVEHRFRAGLGELARAAGLAAPVVSTTRGRAMESPVGQARGLASGFRQVFRDQVDFVVVPGRVTGYGTLEQCFAVLAGLEAQPWVHRVDGFSIKPRRERTAFDLDVSVATIYMPDLSPQGEGVPEVRRTPPELLGVYRPVVMKNVFAPPPPPPAPPTPPARPAAEPVRVAETPPAQKPPPPYDRWRVAGWTESPQQGLMVYFVHTGSGELRALRPGGRVLDAEVLGAGGDAVFVRIGEEEYEALVGQTLDERRVRAPGG